MKLSTCKIEKDGLHLTLEATTCHDIETLHYMGINLEKPVRAFGGFTSMSAYLWMVIPLRNKRRWGFNNENHK